MRPPDGRSSAFGPRLPGWLHGHRLRRARPDRLGGRVPGSAPGANETSPAQPGTTTQQNAARLRRPSPILEARAGARAAGARRLLSCVRNTGPGCAVSGSTGSTGCRCGMDPNLPRSTGKPILLILQRLVTRGVVRGPAQQVKSRGGSGVSPNAAFKQTDLGRRQFLARCLASERADQSHIGGAGVIR